MNTTPATLIGVPIDLGAENLGVDVGPSAFRYQDIVKKLQSAGLEVTDSGDVPVTERSQAVIGDDLKHKYINEILKTTDALAAKVEATIKEGRKAIVLGGDHSLTLGTLSGASSAVGGDLGCIYFDAHGDMNTEATTPTGNVHGMHMASLMGFGAQRLVDAYKPGRKLDPHNLVHIAGCDFDQAEKDLLVSAGIPNTSILDILKDGIKPALQQIDDLAQRVNNVWISLDLDAIDMLYAPGAGMPNAKGLSYREISAFAEYIGNRCNVVGVDVVEYNPLQDVDRKTAELGTELIATFFGKQYSWYSHYLRKNQL
jgi:arginase